MSEVALAWAFRVRVKLELSGLLIRLAQAADDQGHVLKDLVELAYESDTLESVIHNMIKHLIAADVLERLSAGAGAGRGHKLTVRLRVERPSDEVTAAIKNAGPRRSGERKPTQSGRFSPEHTSVKPTQSDRFSQSANGVHPDAPAWSAELKPAQLGRFSNQPAAENLHAKPPQSEGFSDPAAQENLHAKPAQSEGFSEENLHIKPPQSGGFSETEPIKPTQSDRFSPGAYKDRARPVEVLSTSTSLTSGNVLGGLGVETSAEVSPARGRAGTREDTKNRPKPPPRTNPNSLVRDALKARGCTPTILGRDDAAIKQAVNSGKAPDLIADAYVALRDGVWKPGGTDWVRQNLSLHVVIDRLDAYELWLVDQSKPKSNGHSNGAVPLRPTAASARNGTAHVDRASREIEAFLARRTEHAAES